MRLDLRPFRSTKHFRRLAAAMPNAEHYYSERAKIDADITLGVGSNTFRAFRGTDRPSSTYRQWAHRVVHAKRFKNAVLTAGGREGFERLHRWLTRSLDRHWTRRYGKRLSIAHRYKLIDLFVKRLCRLKLPDPKMNAILTTHGHVPIDSNVLRALDGLYSGILLTEGKAMGHIKSEQAYRFYQEIFCSLMAELRVPPLYFDYYAWNLEKDA